jgi:hypothetical protein
MRTADYWVDPTHFSEQLDSTIEIGHGPNDMVDLDDLAGV